MKTLLNRQFTIPFAPNSDAPATTAKLLGLVLNVAPQGGFDFATMRSRTRVADAIGKATDGGEIILEDADYATAKACVEAFRWGSSHPDILTFAEQFSL